VTQAWAGDGIGHPGRFLRWLNITDDAGVAGGGSSAAGEASASVAARKAAAGAAEAAAEASLAAAAAAGTSGATSYFAYKAVMDGPCGGYPCGTQLWAKPISPNGTAV
jgi:hypothetical protein